MTEHSTLSEEQRLHYKEYLANVWKINKKRPVLGSCLEHRYIVLTQMLKYTQKSANFFVHDFPPALDNNDYSDYLENLQLAFLNNVQIRYLLIEPETSLIETSKEFQLLKSLKANSDDLLEVRTASERVKAILKTNSIDGTLDGSLTFETFDNEMNRLEIANSYYSSFSTFKDRDETKRMNAFFDRLYSLSPNLLL